MRAYDRIAQLTRCSFAPKLTSCRTFGRVWHYINRSSQLKNFSFTFVARHLARSLQAVARCASSRESERWGSPRRISSRRWTSRPSSASTWCVHPLEAAASRAYPRPKMNGRPARSNSYPPPDPLLASDPRRSHPHPTHAPLASRSHPPPTIHLTTSRRRARNGATPSSPGTEKTPGCSANPTTTSSSSSPYLSGSSSTSRR